MPLLPFRRRRFWTPFLFLFALLIFVPLAGCQGGPFGPNIPVAENVDQAFKDGLAKEDAAQKAQDASRRDDAVKLWGDASAYYGAVARKFAGSENGGRASLKQGEMAIKQADAPVSDNRNYAAAQVSLRNTLKEYPATGFPTIHTQAQAEYDKVVEMMDGENAKTAWYKVMDTLVNALGGNPKVSPIIAIFAIAIFVTLITWPFRRMQYKSAKEMTRYQPELSKIQAKYKGQPQLLMEKQQEFNKKHGVNQFAGCLPMLLQWPIVLVMYQVILHYQFHFRSATFLWVNPQAAEQTVNWPGPLAGMIGHNLGEQDTLLLLIYAVSMFVQSKLTPTPPTSDPAVAEQQKMMSSVMPVMFFVMMLQWHLPSAFVLYWLSSNILAVTQQWYINRTLPTPPPLVLDADGSPIEEGASAPKPLTANAKLVSPKNKKRK